MRIRQLLNGWWDFQPIAHTDLTRPLYPEAVPREGWQKESYLVPGFFTDHPYPDEWRGSRSGWCRTTFETEPTSTGCRAYLLIEAAIPMAHIFINGQRVAIQEDMFIGDEVDVTDLLVPGLNELAVFITEFKTFPNPQNGKQSLIDVPWGCCIAENQAGIWQDVWLEWRNQAHIDTVAISTSFRQNEISSRVSLKNDSNIQFYGWVSGRVEDRARTSGLPEFILQQTPVTIPPFGTVEIGMAAQWVDYQPWSPTNPKLYHLVIDLSNHSEPLNDDCDIVDSLDTRFGFREIWLEGHRVLLNGIPQRWYGEWAHKSHSHWIRPEYVRQWYQQIKDLNCNYVRMHTFPHPAYFLDIADEMGILVCQETALHGSGQSGWETPELWPRFEAHIRRLIKRDRNHPSLVIWSVENEMRWSLNIVPGAKERLPGYQRLFKQLDATRPAYHDGDSSLWNEDTQDIISRHYGPACHGLGWWTKKQPLHSGEVGRWHYASPYTALQWAGHEVFTDYKALSQSLAKDCSRIVELARANEVTCLFFWNTSGLDNFRPSEERRFEWSEPNSKFLKPLAHKAYESEYAWWSEGRGYRPGWSFQVMRNAFRPLAIIITEERTQFYNNTDAPHTVNIVNDHSYEVRGLLSVSLVENKSTLWTHSEEVAVGPGSTLTRMLNVPLRAVSANESNAAIVTEYMTTGESSAGLVIGDRNERSIVVSNKGKLGESLGLDTVGLMGTSKLRDWLVGHGVKIVGIADDMQLRNANVEVVVISEGYVTPGSSLSGALSRFVEAGGRVLIMEQETSVFTSLSLSSMPIEMAFIRDRRHPALQGIEDIELRFFGDHPFGLPSSDSWVTALPYVKPMDGTPVRPLIDSSGGDFGSGGLQWTPLFEVTVGRGTIISCQLRLSDRWKVLPIADKLLSGCLKYLASYDGNNCERARCLHTSLELPESLRTAINSGSLDRAVSTVNLYNGSITPRDSISHLKEQITRGATLVVCNLNSDTKEYWEQVVGRKIDIWQPSHPVYQLISPGETQLLRGISNEDTCWLENWTYKGQDVKNEITSTLLDIADSKVHLTNSVKSALDVLYGDDNATEWKRTATLSRYFDNELPRVGGGLVEVPVGDGRVIFVQMFWRPDLWQFRRFISLLLMNLGVSVSSPSLLKPTVPMQSKASEGYPTWIRVASPRKEIDLLTELVALSKVHVESYAGNEPFRQHSAWEKMETPNGVITLTYSDTDTAILGMEVSCSQPRKFMETVGGLPNPDLQTFLRLTGSGTVTAYVNGVKWGCVTLTPKTPRYISDIDFEAGSNFVVLEWKATGNQTLSLLFENKDHRPETTFSIS